jgi:hypothetical protein
MMLFTLAITPYNIVLFAGVLFAVLLVLVSVFQWVAHLQEKRALAKRLSRLEEW